MDNFDLAWVDTRFAIITQSFNEFNFRGSLEGLSHRRIQYRLRGYLLHVLREGLFDERTTIQQLVYVYLYEGLQR